MQSFIGHICGFPCRKYANPSNEAVDRSNSVFDGGMLYTDFDKQMSATSAARNKRKLAVRCSVGNLLFGSNLEPPSDTGVNNPLELLPVALLPPADLSMKMRHHL